METGNAMSIIDPIKPRFWEHEHSRHEPYKHRFDFHRIWKQTVVLFSLVAILPLVVTALFGYRVHRVSTEAALMRSSQRLIANASQSIFLFLDGYRKAVNFVIQENSLKDLKDAAHLNDVLKQLQAQMVELKGLALYGAYGKHKAFAGPSDWMASDLGKLPFQSRTDAHTAQISKVYATPKGGLHLTISAVRRMADGAYYGLHALIHTKALEKCIARLALDPSEDLFIINQDGILQTPSRHHGKVLDRIAGPFSIAHGAPTIFETTDPNGNRFIVGQTLIPQTPFRLLIVKSLDLNLQTWYKTPRAFTWILILSVFIILAVTMVLATWLVDQIHTADQERVQTLHQVEQTSKMASLGRLAAGVAHEINNPLAIINEKAGHIRDLFSISEDGKDDSKLIELADAIIASVERSSSVTRRLLDFAGHLDASIEKIDLEEIIKEVHRVLAKESEMRSIAVQITIAADVPRFEIDRGRLEQIFFNLYNYSVSQMDKGGRLNIEIKPMEKDYMTVTLADNGPGIPENELKGIFEPFFTFSTDTTGTNLSLAITYALVQQIGGQISIDSRLGKGTRFNIRIPIKRPGPIR